MLDMGFIKDIQKVIKIIPKNRQTLLFSATYSDEIKKLCDSILTNPATVEVARRNESNHLVTQSVILVDCKRKTELLGELIAKNNWEQVLVFTRTKHFANKVAEHLQAKGIASGAIHGNKSQGARTKALADFKSGATRVLVATDIAARGLDIDQLPHVVNIELPNVPEDYVHRIGRTGRAGNEGEAVSLVCVDENDYLRNIEKLIKKTIDKSTVEGFEPDPAIKAEPILQGRGGKGGGGRGGNSRPRTDSRKSQDGKPRDSRARDSRPKR
jgi:ATP-dependent RNA helicase RhlE